MPKITIDGNETEVEDAFTVIQAAERLGIEVPHYCWHPGLTVVGNCRMCLVEIEKVPKLQIACNTRVTDGMVINTANERVKRAQESVLEFLLVNHPIDCPICDQAGECKLQDYYMDFDRQPSRVPVEQKVRKRKVTEVGPRVILDQERCILCLRCTRFLDEVPKTSELGVFDRGDRVNIALAPGKVLDNPYSENVVDICPVGALTSKSFRFQARVWYLRSTPSVCTSCSRGCNIDVFHRDGVTYRFRPRYNPDVNDYWMCDAGRDGFHDFQGEGRLIHPERRTGDGLTTAGWDEAVADVAKQLRTITRVSGPEAVGIVVSAGATNEESWLATRLASALGGARLAGHAICPADAPADDDLLIRNDRYANRRGLDAFGISSGSEGVKYLLEDAARGSVRGIVLFGADLAGDLGREMVEPAFERLDLLAVFHTRRNESALYANWILPVGAPLETDGSVTNFEGRVQRLHSAYPPPGDSRSGWYALTVLVEACEGDRAVASSEQAFAAAARVTPVFSGLSWAGLGDRGQVLADTD